MWTIWIRDVSIRLSSYHALDEYIPEENEKSIKNVSKWKRDMCQNETLKYMIINEDIKTTYISAKKKKAQAPKAQQNSAVSRGNTLAQQKTATGKKWGGCGVDHGQTKTNQHVGKEEWTFVLANEKLSMLSKTYYI